MEDGEPYKIQGTIEDIFGYGTGRYKVQIGLTIDYGAPYTRHFWLQEKYLLSGGLGKLKGGVKKGLQIIVESAEDTAWKEDVKILKVSLVEDGTVVYDATSADTGEETIKRWWMGGDQSGGGTPPLF
jgi:hypothetical protein